MSSSSDSINYGSSLGVKHIKNREKIFKNADQWLDDKRAIDGAEGLWRVHNSIYDLTDFIEKHPGGQFWLDVTKGTDITEAFESHHITTKPEHVLKEYFIRETKALRNSPFTFDDNGFYRTLKKNVRKALETIPKDDDIKSNIITDGLLVGAFVFAILASTHWNYGLAVVSGILLSSTVIAAHNYYHKKDNFRMYYSDIGMMQSRQWRIIHILSHHGYTNTIADMQAYIIEPLLQVFPHNKSTIMKYGSWIYGPIFIWSTVFFFLFFVRMFQWLIQGYNKHVGKFDLLPAILPVTMYSFGGQPLLSTIGMWAVIITVHSFWFSVIGFASSHFHPDIFIDGDEPRPEDERDWGINQLDTVGDRYEVTGSHFLVLVSFGDHALHHLFPPLDHGLLQHLYPVVQETMKEFNLDIRMTTHVDLILGYFQQLAKDKPNLNPPNLLKIK